MIDLDRYSRNMICKTKLLACQRQLVLVYGKNSKAILFFYQKEKNGRLRLLLRTNGFIGKNGLGKTKEGDLKTPLGLYEFGIAFGMDKKIETRLEYVVINPNLYWIDDPNSKYYNQLVDIEKVRKDWETAEHLIRQKEAYKYAIEIKYNKENNKEKGSAVFLHCSEEKPTSGCISIPCKDMRFLLNNLTKEAKILINNLPSI